MISAAVEGSVDEVVARRLIHDAGGTVSAVYGKAGKNYLQQKIEAFNNAARSWFWFVLVDLDNDAECVPPFRTQWLPEPAAYMCFRVAVREVEAWLIADRERLAPFLRVPLAQIPPEPEALNYPKRTMVDLAVQSTRRDIREDMAPRAGSGRSVGPAYSSRLIEFVESAWRPEVAETSAASLRRCRERLVELISTARQVAGDDPP